MGNQQTAAGAIFLYSWIMLLIGHFVPTPLRILAICVAVLMASAAMVLAVVIAFDEAQDHLGD